MHAAQCLDLAIGVGIGGLQQQLAWRGDGGQGIELQAAGAIGVQREGALVGHHLLRGGAVVVLVVTVAGICRGRARWREAETVVVSDVKVTLAQQGRYRNRQPGGGPALHILQLHVHRKALGRDQRCLAPHRHHAAAHHRQAEGLHAKAAAAEHALALGVAQGHLVEPQLAARRQGERALRALAARGRASPLQRQGLFLPAAHMRDEDGGGRRGHCRQALEALLAQQVLHGHGLAHTQQRPVQDGVRAYVRLGRQIGGHMETPGLDAALPVAPGEGHVLDHRTPVTRRGLGCTGTHEVRAAVKAAAAAFGRLGRDALEVRDALGVGDGVADLVALAVRYTHPGIGHGLAPVQRGHPGQGVLAPQLEVHRQVGDQRRGAHVHRAACAVGRVQQRGTQQGRGDLHHMETRCERDTHHLEGPWVASHSLRQGQCAHPAAPLQQRQHAALHVVLVLRARGRGQGADHVGGGDLAWHDTLIVALHALVPGNDVGVGGHHQVAHLGAPRRGIGGPGRGARRRAGLHLAQRHGQQHGTIGFGEALHDAEGSGRELRQGRQAARGHLQGEAAGVLQRPAGRILEARGQLQRVAAVLREGAGETHRFHDRCGSGRAGLGGHGRQVLAAAGQPNALCHAAGHGRAELQRHVADRQAGGLRVLALAGEAGTESLAHLEVVAFLHGLRHGRLRGACGGRGDHALAVDQLQLGARREAAVAGQRGDVLWRACGLAVHA